MTEPPKRPFPAIDERLLRRKAKQEIRRTMRALRKAMPEAARKARSSKVAERVVGLPEFEQASVVAAFVPIHAELDPWPIVEAAWNAGKTVALPRVDVEADRVVFHVHRQGDPLEESGFGVPEPLPSAATVAPEDVGLVLVPALAVDPRGHRIGYGKGFYDRLLPTLGRALRCAVAFDFQLQAEIPDEPDDIAVDVVITDARTLRVRAAAP